MNEETHHKSWFLRLLHALHRNAHDREELLEILHNAKDKQILKSDALVMIEGVLNVSQTQVRDIMIPRGQMVVIEADDNIDTIVTKVIESTHSRFPVIGESRDEVLGILLAKDLLQHPQQTTPNRNIHSIVRPAVFVPESKRLNILLHEFRINRYHMAIVVDEYGGVSGLVTIEDVLEQIVGNIEDETDIASDKSNIIEVEPNHFEVNPLTSIEDFNDYFSTQIDDNNFDTIGGYVMQTVGHIPKRGETLTLGHFEIIVTNASKRRIQQLKLVKKSHD